MTPGVLSEFPPAAPRGAEPPPDDEAWVRAMNRWQSLLRFARRRGPLIVFGAVGFALAAVLAHVFLLPETHVATLVLAVEEGTAAEQLGVIRLPEAGYRLLALSPDVLAELPEVPEPGRKVAHPAAGGLRVRVLGPREIRREGVARLIQLSATAGDPATALERAETWGHALIEVEHRRARQTGVGALELVLEERRRRQQQRIREQEVRVRVAEEEAARTEPASPFAGRLAELAAAERLGLAAERAILELVEAEVAGVRRQAKDLAVHRPAPAEAVYELEEGSGGPTTVAAMGLSDEQLQQVMVRLQDLRGSLSVLLPARLEPSSRIEVVSVRALLAGLAGALLALMLAAARELSGA